MQDKRKELLEGIRIIILIDLTCVGVILFRLGIFSVAQHIYAVLYCSGGAVI